MGVSSFLNRLARFKRSEPVDVPDNGFGPFLRFQSFDADSLIWRGSVLVVNNDTDGEQTLCWETSAGSKDSVNGTLLYEYNGTWKFWRFDINIEVTDEEQSVKYYIYWEGGNTKEFTFYVAGAEEQWRWAFYSCNGWQAEHVDMELYGDITPLWKDMLARHEDEHLHVMIGGGDQLYNDPVWDVEVLKDWLAIEDPQERAETNMSGVGPATAEYYFDHYTEHFATNFFSVALATIPSVMIWDDHDIFDGYGSYPDYLQDCDVFKAIYKEARRFYLLFQHHTTARQPELSELWGTSETYSFLKLFGPKVAVLGPDARAGRRREQIIPEKDWKLIFRKLEELPDSVQHLVVITAVPFTYPELPAAEECMEALGVDNRSTLVNWFLSKTGLCTAVLNAFGEPELADDLADHWTSNLHEKERRKALKKFLEFAESRSVRVTFVSGDVHVCGVARFTPRPNVPGPLDDYRYMLQVVCSAIGNTPPPEALAKAINVCSRHAKETPGVDGLYEQVLPLFEDEYEDFPRILPRRNWCYVQSTDDCGGGLQFELRVEDDPREKDEAVKSFTVVAPTLVE